MSCANWLAGAIVMLAIGLVAAGAGGERRAQETVERLGGHCEIESRFGLDSMGVVVKAALTECAPSAADLAELKDLRHLRVLDLSRTPIRDRELLQLVDASCPCIIVPDGQTSEAARAMFPEGQIVIGLGGYGRDSVGAPETTRAAGSIAGFSPLRLMTGPLSTIWEFETQCDRAPRQTVASALCRFVQQQRCAARASQLLAKAVRRLRDESRQAVTQ
jgi:hypothetical protein